MEHGFAVARIGEMFAGRVAMQALNVRWEGCVLRLMFAHVVADIGGLDLTGYPKLRIGTWKGAESSEKVAEN
jgi:hypothetical protein